MTTRVIKEPGDIEALRLMLTKRKLPVTVTITAGAIKTDPQNRLAFQWYGDVSTQMGDRTIPDVRAYSKLHLGVPILRVENEVYADKYDRIIRPLPYEDKLELMMEPIDFPVTRLMTTRQLSAYLEAMSRHWSAQGVVLTDPDELRFGGRKVMT